MDKLEIEPMFMYNKEIENRWNQAEFEEINKALEKGNNREYWLEMLDKHNARIAYNKKWSTTRDVMYEGVYTYERLYNAMRLDKINQRRARNENSN